MAPKIKNIIIFTSIGIAIILIYVFFIKKSPDQAPLVSSVPVAVSPGANSASVLDGASSITQDFLSLLLSVKSIKLDDAVFSDPVFLSLQDSSILLVPDGTEGRPNPFAPIGIENIVTTPVSPAKTGGIPAH